MNKKLENKKLIVDLKNTVISRWFKDCRSSGNGENYKLFLTVRNVPSKCHIHRSPSFISKRGRYLFSDLELNSSVFDIREQFPVPHKLMYQHFSGHNFT